MTADIDNSNTTIDVSRIDIQNLGRGMIGGNNSWAIERLFQTSSYIGDEDKDVVPFLAVKRVPSVPGSYRRYSRKYNGVEAKQHIIGTNSCLLSNGLEETEYRPIYDAFRESFGDLAARHGRDSNYIYGHYNNLKDIPDEKLREFINASIKTTVDNTEAYINSPIEYAAPDSDFPRWGRYWIYQDMLGHFIAGRDWALHSTRTYINGVQIRYAVGPYFLADISNDNFTPLVCLVTKPKYIEYIRRSLLLGKEIDKRVVQIWIHPEFDVPRSKWKGFRPYIRKHFLIPLYDAGVPVVEKDNFLELFKNYTPPKLNNIRDYRNWLVECSTEVINTLKTNLK